MEEEDDDMTMTNTEDELASLKRRMGQLVVTNHDRNRAQTTEISELKRTITTQGETITSLKMKNEELRTEIKALREFKEQTRYSCRIILTESEADLLCEEHPRLILIRGAMET